MNPLSSEALMFDPESRIVIHGILLHVLGGYRPLSWWAQAARALGLRAWCEHIGVRWKDLGEGCVVKGMVSPSLAKQATLLEGWLSPL